MHSAHAQAFYLETHPDLPGAADFPMYWGLKKAVERPSGWNEGMADVYNALAADYLYGFDRAGDHLVTFLDNHDEGRFFGKVGKDLDPFDLICHIAFDRKPLTRRERAENVRKRDAFTRYGPQARAVLDALLEKARAWPGA